MSPHGVLLICCLALHPFAFARTFDESEITDTTAFLTEILVPQRTTEINVYYSMEGSNKDSTSDSLNVILRTLETFAPISLGNFHVSRQFAFIFTDSLSYLGKTLRSIRRTRNEERGSLLVYFSSPLADEELQAIFFLCLEMQITNIYVVIEVRNVLNLITYFPFTTEQCFGYKPQVICENRGDGFRSVDGSECIIRPKKLSNFYGCPLRVNVFLSPPHLFLQGPGILTGLEADILKTMAKKLNFTIVFLKQNISAIVERFHLLHTGPADISLGRLRTTTIQRRNVTSSFAYCNSKLLLVTHTGRSLFSLERILIPASPSVWLLLILFTALAYVLIQIMNCAFPYLRNLTLGADNRYPMYWVWVIIFGGPVELRPRGYFARSVLFQWILLHFLLRCGYQSFVYTSIRLDWKMSTPRNLIEAMMNGYTLTSSVETYQSLLHTRYLPKLIKTYEHSDLEALHQLEEQDGSTIAIIVPKEVFRFHLATTRPSKLIIVGKPLLEQMISMHFREQSYLKDPFDSVLGRMQVSGLLYHWLEIYLTSSGRRRRTVNVPESIKWADVKGHFQIYGALVIVSFVGLLLEVLSLKVRFLRRFFI